MATDVTWMTWGVVGLALASAVALVARRRKTDAELLFAVFCGSVAMAMLRPGLGDAPAWLVVAVTLGACATCNVYWLVARALFRGPGGVGRVHIAAAAGIATLIMLYRFAEMSGVERGMAVIGDVLTLASSTVLVLAAVEALRGWSTAPAAERHLRIAFVGVYGTCLTVGTVSGAWAGVDPGWAPAHRLVVLCCTIAIVLFTHGALMLRRRRPWTPPIAAATDAAAPDTASPRAGPTTEDLALAAAIRRVLEQRALYREPELKVAAVAAAVGSAEHKVSRAITQGLGERNFNQWVNRYRIDHACRLLASGDERSVLEIALDSGFASLGPFNRAFKALTGTTPTAWRAARRRADAAGIDAAGCRVS